MPWCLIEINAPSCSYFYKIINSGALHIKKAPVCLILKRIVTTINHKNNHKPNFSIFRDVDLPVWFIL